jgi:phosphoglycerate dehydrogenase-like enzyme
MKILLTGAYKYTEGQLSRLKALGADFLYVEDEREELSFDVSAVDAVVCNGLFLYNDIKKFKNLKFIQLTSAGLDRVPAEYIKSKNISLFNARGVYSVPMAEFAVLGTLLIYKKSFFFRVIPFIYAIDSRLYFFRIINIIMRKPRKPFTLHFTYTIIQS